MASNKAKKSFNASAPRSKVDAFVMSAAHGDIAAVTEFLKQYPKAIDKKDTHGAAALLRSARYGQTEMVAFLLKNGADIETKNNTGWTPLMQATLYGQIDTIELLLEMGANIKAKNEAGWDSKRVAKENHHIQDMKDVSELLKEWPKMEKQRQAAEKKRQPAQARFSPA